VYSRASSTSYQCNDAVAGALLWSFSSCLRRLEVLNPKYYTLASIGSMIYGLEYE
jgi:hypothetical protein